MQPSLHYHWEHWPSLLMPNLHDSTCTSLCAKARNVARPAIYFQVFQISITTIILVCYSTPRMGWVLLYILVVCPMGLMASVMRCNLRYSLANRFVHRFKMFLLLILGCQAAHGVPHFLCPAASCRPIAEADSAPFRVRISQFTDALGPFHTRPTYSRISETPVLLNPHPSIVLAQRRLSSETLLGGASVQAAVSFAFFAWL